MVEVFAQREIIVGVISLGHTLLLLTGLAAGYQAAQLRSLRHGMAPLVVALTRGLLAGAATGVLVSALVAIVSVVNLRAMFVSVSPELLGLLSFGRGIPGIPLVLLAGALTGAIGAIVSMLPPRLRRPLVGGFTVVLSVGLFQELLQQLLQGEEGIRVTLRALIFAEGGFPLRGAIIVFLVYWVASTVWTERGARIRQGFARLPAPQQRRLRFLTVGLGVALLLLLPLIAGPFLSQVLVLVGLYTLMGLGLNLEVGFAGLLDLGFVAFFAIGAYTVGLLMTATPLAVAHLSFWTALPIAVVVTLVAGVFFGLPILRIRGDYLAIATLGFGEIIRILVLSDFLRPWLGGSQGVLAIPKPIISTFEFQGPEQLFYLTLASSALVAFLAARLRDSRLGRAWMAMREDEDIAQAMGINLVNVKLLAYGIGAAFAGVSGGIFAVMVSSVFPHSFSVLISINVLALIIVGGLGSLPGVAVGALALIGLPELLREFTDFRFLIYGVALILMMQLRPEGLWPAATLKRELHEEAVEMAPPREQEQLVSAKESDA
jgi:branched-chain amino acid transport system permease protein